MEINERIGGRVRELRDANGWSLDLLAERSSVSRSTISLIERGESSPTATVLDKLATALNVPLGSLFEQGVTEVAASSPVSRARDRAVWTDPASGYVRRQVSPAAWSPIQLVEVDFPAGQRVNYETGSRDTEIHQQIWILDGTMEITAGETIWRLDTGDCLAMRLDCPTAFRNPTRKPACYMVALTSVTPDKRRNG
ncbi:helix-turn-helix domain-containing protein [Paraburkholderia sp. BCC1886]|uniref:helix-turn-helix domain-containing protein n=1 Tax=Paraburkholderia sp. BCC1886 TaxID=2562670 RepID=UPI001182AA85|nr:XRE family transcriptional regulator [Paraburkholderia sp. BCC1886]